MRLLPEDLGTKWHIALVRHRSLGPAVAWSKPVEPRLGSMGRFWIKGMNLREDVAAATLPMAANETQGYVVGFGAGMGWMPLAAIVGAYFASPNLASLVGSEALAISAASGFCYWAGVYMPRRTLRRLHQTPVRLEEIETLRNAEVPGLPPVLGQLAQRFFRLWNRGVQAEHTEDFLERSFLGLILDVLRSEDIPEAMQDDLRATLRDLGDAVAQMPPAEEGEIPVGSVEAADLRGDAQMLLARAEQEQDPVVEASLRRQADALLERARSAEHSGVVARRTRYLRQELRAQIDALRAALPSFGRTPSATASSRTDISAFARLAESVRGVAAEAASVAAAHEELNEGSYASREAALGNEARAYRNAEEDSPQQVHLGRR